MHALRRVVFIAIAIAKAGCITKRYQQAWSSTSLLWMKQRLVLAAAVVELGCECVGSCAVHAAHGDSPVSCVFVNHLSSNDAEGASLL